ncbi:MAG: ribokinase [Dehalococcoidia bacterium]
MTRIVVLGSLMQDLVVRAPRLPAVGETLFGHSFDMFVGGKGGNQAIAAARMGAGHVSMMGALGDDAFAPAILAALESAGIDTTHVRRDAPEGTGVAIPVVLDGGANSIFSIPRANLTISRAHVEAAASTIKGAHILLLQFEVSMEANLAAAAIASSAGVPIVLNAAPVAQPPPGLTQAASVLVVNEPEADSLAPFRDDRLDQARALRSLGPQTVVITLGERGCVIASDQLESALPAYPVTAIDSVGAGDAFCGALAVALAENRPLADALRLASAAGALAVTRHGAAPSLPLRGEVQELVSKGTFTPP